MTAVVALLVATGRDLIVRKYHVTSREFWNEDDALGAGNCASLTLRRSCLERENRAARWSQVAVLSGWSEMPCFRVVLDKQCRH